MSGYLGKIDDLRIYQITTNSEIATLCDIDGDELTDYQEIELGTDPFIADTDGDGFQTRKLMLIHLQFLQTLYNGDITIINLSPFRSPKLCCLRIFYPI